LNAESNCWEYESVIPAHLHITHSQHMKTDYKRIGNFHAQANYT
jgi:hypothetical protein